MTFGEVEPPQSVMMDLVLDKAAEYTSVVRDLYRYTESACLSVRQMDCTAKTPDALAETICKLVEDMAFECCCRLTEKLAEEVNRGKRDSFR